MSEGRLSDGLLWQGFDYRWDKHPHRLSYLGSWFDYEFSRRLQAEHSFEAKIGAFPGDRADYGVGYGLFRARDVFVGFGQRAGIRLAAPLGRLFGVGDPITIRLPWADLQSTWTGPRAGFERAAVVLNGFHLAVDPDMDRVDGDPWTSGWHLGHLGFWIPQDSVQLEGGELSFRLERRFGPALSPDPFTEPHPRGPGRWPESATCVYRLTLHYAVIAGAAADFAFEPQELPLSATQPTTSHRASEQTLWSGPSGFSGAMPAISGFDVALQDARDPDRDTVRDARYIRELRVALGPARFDPATGSLRARTMFAFSNDGDLPGTAKDWRLSGSVKTVGLFFRDGTLPSWKRRRGFVENGSFGGLDEPLRDVQAAPGRFPTWA